MSPRDPKENTTDSSTLEPDNRDNNTQNPPPKKKRRQRQLYSCAECRRLKLKCDRQVPCSNCIRRGCQELCPNGSKQTVKGNSEDSIELRKRLEAVESLLTEHGVALPPSTSNGNSNDNEMANRPRSKSDTIEEDAMNRRSSVQMTSPSRYQNEAQRERTTSVSARRSQSPASQPISKNQSVAAPTNPSQIIQSQTPHHAGDVHSAPVNPISNPTPTYGSMTMVSPGLSRVHFDFNTSPEDYRQTWAAGIHPSISYRHPSTVSSVRSDPTQQEQSFGTLVLSHGGGSKYLGPTAASEWLKDQEIQEAQDFGDTPGPSRAPSPSQRQRPVRASTILDQGGIFPFDVISPSVSTQTILDHLPPRHEASVLAESYYRYFSWHYNVVPRQTFQPIFDRAYRKEMPVNRKVGAQELALLYIILAMGALHNLELPPNDPIAEEYSTLSKICLAKGEFMIHCTTIGIMALHVMAHFHLETEKGRNGDSAWPLWGLAMRLIQGMGLHRDGARWNLAPEIVEERRRVFWESHSADILQANCFSRPSSIPPDYIDTCFPSEDPEFLIPTQEAQNQEKGYWTLKFELAKISGAILDLAMKVDPPTYDTVTALHERLRGFEQQVPYHLRCRTALLALPSTYPDPTQAVRDSPEVSKRDLHLTFQQFTLYVQISETILFLHRPYFAKALHERLSDPTRSVYGQSYLSVVERCNYHAFNSAVCMGTLILQTPHNPMATFALSQIDASITLYTSVVQSHASPRLAKNLQWLLRLRHRAHTKMNQNPPDPEVEAMASMQTSNEEDEDIELLGWRTRLIHRATKGTQKATTISPMAGSQAYHTPSPGTSVTQTITQALQQHFGGNGAGGEGMPVDQLSSSSSNPIITSTDLLLHQFWDPRMLHETFAGEQTLMGNVEPSSVNWWDWDALAGGASSSNQ
ncbi:hypothetical protein I307_04958 [Cryptococcus deuterogattii 99/473]|uniref:Unplaced genomic scaffold supercont1.9, whole genome shotgun sequence n=1 Tax=Cryptococcus deuterogattii Ram5 TaxID=1296110 RepID=A0A0D0TVL3_9TREE|nr:hypothetical protein I313_03862 [Cryptococcus deuterogattii Ram5]KIY55771.1 hypothetical protein I307_04958 [Cryptococcus deuterogattii 99/473]